MRRKVLHVSNMWPSEQNPQYGAFVKAQIDSLKHHSTDMEFDVLGLTESGGFSKYSTLRRRLKACLRQERPSLIHIHYGYTAIAIIDICRRHKIPTLLSYCGSDIYGAAGNLKRKVRYALWVRFSILAGYLTNSCLVKTEHMFKILPNSLQRRTRIIPNGVDVTLFAPIEKHEARKNLGWTNDPVVLFAGRPENPQKNFELASEAISLVRRTTPNINLTFPQDVHHSDMTYYLNAADILLLTSLKEGSSNILKEALACNTPIVAVAVGDAPWLLENVENCHVVDYEPQVIAAAIERIVQGGCHKTNGRDLLLEKQLDDKSVSETIVAIYNSLIG